MGRCTGCIPLPEGATPQCGVRSDYCSEAEVLDIQGSLDGQDVPEQPPIPPRQTGGPPGEQLASATGERVGVEECLRSALASTVLLDAHGARPGRVSHRGGEAPRSARTSLKGAGVIQVREGILLVPFANWRMSITVGSGVHVPPVPRYQEPQEHYPKRARAAGKPGQILLILRTEARCCTAASPLCSEFRRDREVKTRRILLS